MKQSQICNRCRLTGTVAAAPQPCRGGFLCMLAVERRSGAVDHVPVLLREAPQCGDALTVEGRFASENRREGGRSHLILRVYANSVRAAAAPFIFENRIVLRGWLCRAPVLRKTPAGREIADLLLAVGRPDGRSDYLPVICWEGMARRANMLRVGDEVELTGRIQSREYIRKADGEKHTAFEISASQIRWIEQEQITIHTPEKRGDTRNGQSPITT